MAQQREFNQDQGENTPRDPSNLSSDRGVGSRGATFVGGDIDPVTGNLMPGSSKSASQGFLVTGSENPAPPPPAPSQLLQDVQGTAQPAAPVAAAPTFYRKDKLNGVERVGSWFCYGRGTLILMQGGAYKQVQDLVIGDRVMLGGEVIAQGKAKGGFTFLYKGERVTGSHLVFEDGQFVRVSESKLRSPDDDYHGGVYPIVTEQHLLVTRSHISADFTECEGGEEMLPIQRQSKLNREVEKLAWLKTMEAKYCAHVEVA